MSRTEKPHFLINLAEQSCNRSLAGSGISQETRMQGWSLYRKSGCRTLLLKLMEIHERMHLLLNALQAGHLLKSGQRIAWRGILDNCSPLDDEFRVVIAGDIYVPDIEHGTDYGCLLPQQFETI